MPEKQTQGGPQLGLQPQVKTIDSEVLRSLPSDFGNPASGRRAAFRDVRRQLTEDELKSSGVQKLLLDMLQEADDERERLKAYVSAFHTVDKTAAILGEQVKTQEALDVFFGVGVGLGGAIIGLVPFLWSAGHGYGIITAIVGLCLTVGATVGRISKKSETRSSSSSTQKTSPESSVRSL